MAEPRGYEPELLDLLESLPRTSFDDRVWRAAFEGQEPLRPNTRGARWNPKDVSALYTSRGEACARAEFDHILGLQPVPPSRPAILYTLAVKLAEVLDLSNVQHLRRLGLSVELPDDSLEGQEPYRRIGGAVAFLGLEGLQVPSMRLESGINLVIYTDNVQSVGFSDITIVSSTPY